MRKVCDDDPCNQEYVICNKLNIKPVRCIKENETYYSLYKEAYNFILNNRIDQMVNNVNNPSTYDAIYILILQHFNLPQANGLRIVITTPDGKVMIDTNQGTMNTFDNYIFGKIGENHNTRVAIMQAQMEVKGTGFETKLSATNFTRQKYVALRLGPWRNSAGTFRISKLVGTI